MREAQRQSADWRGEFAACQGKDKDGGGQTDLPTCQEDTLGALGDRDTELVSLGCWEPSDKGFPPCRGGAFTSYKEKRNLEASFV